MKKTSIDSSSLSSVIRKSHFFRCGENGIDCNQEALRKVFSCD